MKCFAMVHPATVETNDGISNAMLGYRWDINRQALWIPWRSLLSGETAKTETGTGLAGWPPPPSTVTVQCGYPPVSSNMAGWKTDHLYVILILIARFIGDFPIAMFDYRRVSLTFPSKTPYSTGFSIALPDIAWLPQGIKTKVDTSWYYGTAWTRISSFAYETCMWKLRLQRWL